MSSKTLKESLERRHKERKRKEGSARGCGLTLSFSDVRLSQLRCVNYLGGWREKEVQTSCFSAPWSCTKGLEGALGGNLCWASDGEASAPAEKWQKVISQQGIGEAFFSHKQDQLLGRCRRSAMRELLWLAGARRRCLVHFAFRSTLAGRPKRLLDISRA